MESAAASVARLVVETNQDAFRGIIEHGSDLLTCHPSLAGARWAPENAP